MGDEAPTMRAAQLTTIPAAGLDLSTVAPPMITRDDDVLIAVSACGVCGTDLHILDGQAYRPQLPFTLGHEPVGVVVAAGSAAAEWIGRRVTMTLFTGDGACELCEAGDERLCRHLRSITGVLGAPGAYAGIVRVHAAQLVPVPDALADAEVASLVDSGATAANSVRQALVRAPDRVLVLGGGPIGHLSAEMLREAGVVTEVVEPNPQRAGALAQLGHRVVPSIDEALPEPAVIIDCTGVATAFQQGINALAPRGLYLLAGYATVPDFDFGAVSRNEATLQGIRSGSRADLEHILDLAASRAIRLPEIHQWPLEQINDAFTALRAGRVTGKAIISITATNVEAGAEGPNT
ncbi:alcohol dehydrogenase catalytic domain-containing protein [Microbacterium sp. ASV49]|uniref:Alcohol dehydrogenase catalytic domain-containing protein n=1 Tax=Microbacterium candidum TaxID=3041922 RepID=A0ABT7N212_9MICO|nr:alcohol dehydrogenase catalytic domain-containing protein [Microbacterium sp. ASV49]MDL9980751.1 alcohol dehydrogenase catalytic domain-containing protein [Microbacterium sp. ASV49]